MRLWRLRRWWFPGLKNETRAPGGLEASVSVECELTFLRNMAPGRALLSVLFAAFLFFCQIEKSLHAAVEGAEIAGGGLQY